jgi:hypothetical protein
MKETVSRKSESLFVRILIYEKRNRKKPMPAKASVSTDRASITMVEIMTIWYVNC